MATRSRSALLLLALFVGVALPATLFAAQAFVPAPEATQLRGSQQQGSAAGAVVGAVVAAGAPFAAHAVPDEYIPYRMYGEWTVDFAVQYFALTTAGTLFAFGCYFILTKLKII